MASMTMSMTASSFLNASTSFSTFTATKPPATARRGLVVAKASSDSEGEKSNMQVKKSSGGGRRDLVFAAAAAAAWSIGKVAMAQDEPKAGTPEAKKKYAPVCVTMPTARICRK
ncbi:hypothetical protein FNV43_RR02958 [Rhamnella rubrinervis]|uniref:Photosystem II 5 kDa protein, chloroplastic n=1 Tax=Rhamnella rubrinervis TaxID=2594499 RepID=A0A8K0MP50_9ROSA|nr:hypothetical protein FNV43_RR02958 [Rhamnella rubrinervis]